MNEKQTSMKYRSVEELEELLRREGDTMSTDNLLQLLEELDRRKNASSDAEAAWSRFQTDYLADTKTVQPVKPKWRSLATLAAVLVLVVGLSVTVGAIGGRDLWGVIVDWTRETFTFTGMQQPDSDIETYETFHEILEAQTGQKGLAPTVIPEGFELAGHERTDLPGSIVHQASYLRGKDFFQIIVQTYLPEETVWIEKDDTPVECYSADGVDYYIMRNGTQLTAAWVRGGYSCQISGSLTREELMEMLASVS